MFDLAKVQSLNDLEVRVYQYVLEHEKEVMHLTIRQLAKTCLVSTSTVLRFCVKMGYSGFSDFKYALKYKQTKEKDLETYYSTTCVVSFLKRMSEKTFSETLKPALTMIENTDFISFSGLGTSGILANYGSRYFVNMGINAYCIDYPFSPIPQSGFDNALAVILSVSGETEEMIKQLIDFKKSGTKVLSMTNNELSTIARLADYNISYYMPFEKSKYGDRYVNTTTQIPVIALLELLGQAGSQKKQSH